MSILATQIFLAAIAGVFVGTATALIVNKVRTRGADPTWW